MRYNHQTEFPLAAKWMSIVQLPTLRPFPAVVPNGRARRANNQYKSATNVRKVKRSVEGQSHCPIIDSQRRTPRQMNTQKGVPPQKKGDSGCLDNQVNSLQPKSSQASTIKSYTTSVGNENWAGGWGWHIYIYIYVCVLLSRYPCLVSFRESINGQQQSMPVPVF